MAKVTAPLLPATSAILGRFGERLRLARKRRRLTAKQVAERAGMAPMTLRSLERGGSGVTMGAYLAVMQVLGIETDLELLCVDDPVGRQLQDAQLPERVRTSTPGGSAGRQSGRVMPSGNHDIEDENASRRVVDPSPRKASRGTSVAHRDGGVAGTREFPTGRSESVKAPIRGAERARTLTVSERGGDEDADWIARGDFASAAVLAGLIASRPVATKKKR